MNRLRDSRGFTLVELSVVIIVVVILAVIVVVANNGIRDRAHSAATAANVRSYINALQTMEQREGIFYQGSGCLGGGSDDICWLGARYEGAGCEAYFNGNVPPQTHLGSRNLEFDEKIEKYLGYIPEKIQTQPFVHSVVVAEDCIGVMTVSGATYQTARRITVRQDGAVMMTVSGDRSEDDAWQIMYMVPGADSECHVDGSIRGENTIAESLGANYTVCYVLHGDVVYE